jgi:hypothetical protein
VDCVESSLVELIEELLGLDDTRKIKIFYRLRMLREELYIFLYRITTEQIYVLAAGLVPYREE